MKLCYQSNLFKHLQSLFGLIVLMSLSGIAHSHTFSTYTRDHQSLNGEWRYIVDPYENGFYNYRWEKFDDQKNPSKNAFFNDSKVQNDSELLEYDFDEAPSINVPSDWNTQDKRLYFYEGSVWYRKKFEYAKTNDKRVFIRFGAANYRSDVYLNGKKLGVHVGGFTPFSYEISKYLIEGENSLVLKVDNKRGKSEVPTLNTDWWNYGGITRDVSIFSVPTTFISEHKVSLESLEKRLLNISVKLDGENNTRQSILVKIPELNISTEIISSDTGIASAQITLPEFTPWQPTQAKLYEISLETKSDRIVDRIGLRTIETKDKQIILNGKPIFLRGISIHEEYALDGGGRVKNAEQAAYLLQQAESLNANFVRLAHYPHNEHMLRLADQMGLLVWSEIPVYWTIDWLNPNTYNNAESQLVDMINRDYNRSSVIIWSIANETPVSDARNEFLARLANKTRSLDQTRLLSAAMEKHYDKQDPNLAVVSDPLSDIVDIVSFNQYIGWYEGLSDKLERTDWYIPYNKPVIISEFGAGAKHGLHGDKKVRWTEEFQADVYVKTLKMLEEIDGWSGVSPWILKDFRSPRRIHGFYQNDFNRKGLLSETGKPKEAFKVLKAYYESIEVPD